jgi:hypothetical protein
MATGDTPINVRGGPSTAFAPIGVLNSGDSAPITGRSANGQWWQIDYRGQHGWVSAGVAPTAGETGVVAVVAEPTLPVTWAVQATATGAAVVQATPTDAAAAQSTAIWEGVNATGTAIAQQSQALLQASNATSTALAASMASAPTGVPGAPRACCKVCTKGVACGNTCISARYTCHQQPGCACNG